MLKPCPLVKAVPALLALALFAALWLLAPVLADAKNPLEPTDAQEWLTLGFSTAVALGGIALAWWLGTYLLLLLGHFPPLVIGLVLLTQPAVSVLVGWLSFGEVLALPDAIGMALVGAALVLARLGEGKSA